MEDFNIIASDLFRVGAYIKRHYADHDVAYLDTIAIKMRA